MQCINYLDANLIPQIWLKVMWNLLEFPAKWENHIWEMDVSRMFRNQGMARRLASMLWNCRFRLSWTCVSIVMHTCVLISRTSSINDCANPPLNPSIHRMPNDVIEIFVIVQLCTWSGRPANIRKQTLSSWHFVHIDPIGCLAKTSTQNRIAKDIKREERPETKPCTQTQAEVYVHIHVHNADRHPHPLPYIPKAPSKILLFLKSSPECSNPIFSIHFLLLFCFISVFEREHYL